MNKPDKFEKMVERAVPTNWCDALLTGKDAVIHGPPYNNQDIEQLLLAIQKRVLDALARGKEEG